MIFTAIITMILLGTRIGLVSLFAFAIIMTGMLIGSVDEYEFSAVGTFYGLASDFLMALYGILVKKSLIHVNNDQWLFFSLTYNRTLLYYSTAITVFALIPLTLYVEIAPIMQLYWSWEFITFITVAAFMSFLINIAMYLQINYTSPLTNSVSGNLKVF